MPIGHPGSPSTIAGASSSISATCSSASASATATACWRKRFWVSRSAARRAASSGSSQRQSSSARRASSIRPAALIRGPTANAISVPRGGGEMPATSQSARSPGRSAILGRPSRTITRFSPRSGIMSAIVPSAASPSDASALPAGTTPRDSSAWTSLKATPAPASPSNSYVEPGSLGLTSASAGASCGGDPPGASARW